MKLLLTLLLTFTLLSSASAQEILGTWVEQTLPSFRGLRHDDVEFVTPDIGWIVNTQGNIYNTVDGGENWESQKNDGNLTFRSIAFLNQDVGFVGLVQSEPAVLYGTVNGGQRWSDFSSRISGPSVLGICGMQAVTDSMIVGVGAFWGAPRFVVSRDAGETWTSTDMSAYAQTLVDVHFYNDSTGVAIGGDSPTLTGQSVVLRTEDGGATWSNVHTSTKWASVDGEWGWKITTPSDSINYISVEYLSNDTAPAKVLKSTDGGKSWSTISVDGSVDPSGLQGIGFLSDSTGWVGGRGTTSFTNDGGTSWTQLAPYHPSSNPTGVLDATLNRIFVLQDSVAFAVGRYAYRFMPAAPVAIEEFEPLPASFTLEQNYPNPFNPSTTIAYTLHEPLKVTVKLFGPNGRLIKTMVNDELQPTGRHEVVWNGRTQSGEKVASGVYFYTLDIGSTAELKSMILIK